MGCRDALRGEVRVGGVPILVVLGNEDPDDDLHRGGDADDDADEDDGALGLLPRSAMLPIWVGMGRRERVWARTRVGLAHIMQNWLGLLYCHPETFR